MLFIGFGLLSTGRQSRPGQALCNQQQIRRGFVAGLDGVCPRWTGGSVLRSARTKCPEEPGQLLFIMFVRQTCSLKSLF